MDWIFWFLTVCTEVRSDVRVKESGVTPEESVDGWDRGCREIWGEYREKCRGKKEGKLEGSRGEIERKIEGR